MLVNIGRTDPGRTLTADNLYTGMLMHIIDTLCAAGSDAPTGPDMLVDAVTTVCKPALDSTRSFLLRM